MNLPIYLISAIVALILNIAIHELGHLAAGRMSGYLFLSFRLGPLVWTKTGDKTVLTVSPSSLIAGQCLMKPPADEKDFKFILYNMGGGLANLLFAAICLVILIVVPTGIELFSLLFGALFSSLGLGLTNLIPLKLAVPNDGYNVFAATRSEEAAHGFYIMLRVNQEVTAGKRFREFFGDTFTVSGSADTTNIFIANLFILEAARLFDLGMYDESLHVYSRLNIDALPMYYCNSIYMDFLYYYSFLRPDSGSARFIRSKKNMTKLLSMGIPGCTRTNAAYEYFVNGNRVKGTQLLQTAKKQQSSYPSKGIALMEAEYIAFLEKHFQ